MSIGTAAYGQGRDALELAHVLAKFSWLNAATVLRSQPDPRLRGSGDRNNLGII